MKRERVARLTGKPGNWVAVELRTRRVVAEATTLKAVARIVARKRLKRTSFTRVPSPDCALILEENRHRRDGPLVSISGSPGRPLFAPRLDRD